MVQWFEVNCAKCNKTNLVYNGDTSDLTVPDIDYFRCFACETVNEFAEYPENDPQVFIAKDPPNDVDKGHEVPR